MEPHKRALFLSSMSPQIEENINKGQRPQQSKVGLVFARLSKKLNNEVIFQQTHDWRFY